jgi:hypothetical protein
MWLSDIGRRQVCGHIGALRAFSVSLLNIFKVIDNNNIVIITLLLTFFSKIFSFFYKFVVSKLFASSGSRALHPPDGVVVTIRR